MSENNEKKYHHGNLKHALIEAGIGLVNESGESQLSLRKVARLCNVSQAAPYAHFKSKEDLLHVMKVYVLDNFTQYLKQAIETVSSSSIDNKDISCGELYERKIVAMGKAYVSYFLHHPTHYDFLFTNDFIKINLSLSDNSQDNYEPFEILKSLYLNCIKANGKSPTSLEQERDLIGIWSAVQGLSSIVCMKQVTWDKDWETELEHLII